MSSETPLDEHLAIEGGEPVRREPLPLEFPGVHFMDGEEIEAATRVLKSRNNVSLQNHSSVDGRGFPWNLPGNGEAGRYAKGSCPSADTFFERSILVPIPACLSAEDEQDLIHAFRKVITAATSAPIAAGQ